MDPQPADVGQGLCRLELQRRIGVARRGRHRTGLGEEDQEARHGQERRSRVPRLVPQGVDSAWGQIVLAKAETLDVQRDRRAQGAAAHRSAARPDERRPPSAAPPRPSSSTAIGRCDATVTRYQLEEIKRTSIDRAVVRMVVTPAGEASVQALYRVQVPGSGWR